MFDPMAELTGSSGMGDSDSNDERPQQSDRPQRPPRGDGGGDRSFSDELHSVTIHAKQRTFYIDLKQSSNGKFFKVSEKSRNGRKTTIMFDAEDLDKFIAAFNDMKTHM